MADVTLGQGNLGFVDKRRVAGQAGINVSTPANYASVAAMRARLIVLNSTYYTTTRLDKMTVNDMVFAIRGFDDVAGL
jgi:hypothetical protein